MAVCSANVGIPTAWPIAIREITLSWEAVWNSRKMLCSKSSRFELKPRVKQALAELLCPCDQGLFTLRSCIDRPKVLFPHILPSHPCNAEAFALKTTCVSDWNNFHWPLLELFQVVPVILDQNQAIFSYNSQMPYKILCSVKCFQTNLSTVGRPT